ncbi:MAG: ABC transporter permease [Deltaproteobacteria bacterium]
MTPLRRIAAIVLRQAYIMRASPARLFSTVAWVAIDIVLWGFITRYLNAVTSPGFDFIPVLLGAVLLFDFFTRVMHGVTTAFLEDVWSHNFLNVFASPVSIPEYVSGLVLSSVATSSVGLLAMLVLAKALFGLSFYAFGLPLVPFLLVLFLSGIALGIFGTALVLRLGPASEWLVWPIPAFISPFAAVFYPVSALPGWMQDVSRLLPPAYVFEGMRAIVEGRPFPGTALLWSALLAVLYILAASWFFARVHRRIVRTGLLARYSAESVG